MLQTAQGEREGLPLSGEKIFIPIPDFNNQPGNSLMATIGKPQPAHRSHLFTVRLWAEELGDGQSEWRGRVQHVLSGETHHFRDWATLVELVLAMLSELEGDEAAVKTD